MTSSQRVEHQLERRAHRAIDSHPLFQGRAGRFEFVCREGAVVVRGSVPTFYLKQVLQHVLQNVDGVYRVDNQVNVSPHNVGCTANPPCDN